ncbi:RHS repeat domain-containing protein, partial [Xanthomonas sp. SHU 199]|uniref:RHS repeat domain-containing protein n=1 Tax=Xanthomonas sp. SHU 199 TaxID=1591174 RepID=UPI00058438FD
ETWALGYAYDANGHLTAHRYPSGQTVDYAPNALGQPTQAGSYATGVSYYPNGAIKQFSYGNGIVHTMTQNARQLPDTSRDAYGDTAFLSDGYDYDANGNVAAISDGATGRGGRGNRDMTYDGLDRLISTKSAMFGSTPASYSYDVLDNLTHVVAPGRDQYYCYDANWQLTNV